MYLKFASARRIKESQLSEVLTHSRFVFQRAIHLSHIRSLAWEINSAPSPDIEETGYCPIVMAPLGRSFNPQGILSQALIYGAYSFRARLWM
jgi:hypothetical protein